MASCIYLSNSNVICLWSVLQSSDAGVLNKLSAVKVGYNHSLIPEIIWQYVSVGCISPVEVVIALSVLAVSGCSEP